MMWQSTLRKHIKLGIILELGVIYGFFFLNEVFWVKATHASQYYSCSVFVFVENLMSFNCYLQYIPPTVWDTKPSYYSLPLFCLLGGYNPRRLRIPSLVCLSVVCRLPYIRGCLLSTLYKTNNISSLYLFKEVLFINKLIESKVEKSFQLVIYIYIYMQFWIHKKYFSKHGYYPIP